MQVGGGGHSTRRWTTASAAATGAQRSAGRQATPDKTVWPPSTQFRGPFGEISLEREIVAVSANAKGMTRRDDILTCLQALGR